MNVLRPLTAWWRIDLLALGLVSLAGLLTSFAQRSDDAAKVSAD